MEFEEDRDIEVHENAELPLRCVKLAQLQPFILKPEQLNL